MVLRCLLMLLMLPVLLYARAIETDAGPPGQDSCRTRLSKKTEKIYREGTEYLRRGSYNLAGQQMRAVLRDEPDCADAWFVLGLSNYKKQDNNFREAQRCFLNVEQLCPGYDHYLDYYLGEIYYSQDSFQQAARHLERFLADVDKIRTDADYNRASELFRYSAFTADLKARPVPFEPQVVDGISTASNEYLPILSPDNQVALFTREIKVDPDRNSLVREIRMVEKFMYSDRGGDGIFTCGEAMPPPFNMQDNEGGATLTADNNTLFYTVCSYNRTRSYLNCDLFVSERTGGEWGPIRSVGAKVNQPESWESQPSISADGRTLYFVSDRQGGFGGYDLYRSVRDSTGTWGDPVNLGGRINSAGNEKSPFLHPDGKTLYFSSDGHMGLGGYDIFFARGDEEGNWGKPVNIGFPINSGDDELGFFVSTDGQQGFFASNKYNGKGGWDLYSFDLYEAARPERVLFIRGNIRTELSAEPLKARIELKNVETKRISQVPMDTVTGNYVAVAPFNSDYIMTVRKTDHVYESRYISRVDTVFSLPATVDIEMKPIELNKAYRISDILFLFNSADLTRESKAILDQFIEFLRDNPAITIEIQGHTDNIGNDAANLVLSENRARSVHAYLVEQGIPAGRLSYRGLGESEPVAANDTEEGRARNRRTVFVIKQK